MENKEYKEPPSVKWVREIRQKMYEMWRDDPAKFYEEERKNTEEFKKKYIKPRKKKKTA